LELTSPRGFSVTIPQKYTTKSPQLPDPIRPTRFSSGSGRAMRKPIRGLQGNARHARKLSLKALCPCFKQRPFERWSLDGVVMASSWLRLGEKKIGSRFPSVVKSVFSC
jgi:hypothetical protein